MTSCPSTDNTDCKNVEVKSELHTSSTDKMDIKKCIYNLMFNNIEPSDDQKLKVRIYFSLGILDNIFNFR
jgi:hypothetical protein